MKTITLLSDFGAVDQYVAVMKGEILKRCPGATLVDITHNAGPQNISQASYILGQSWNSFPQGTIHLAVVDPGVGGERQPMVALLDGHLFVCPDNGLISEVFRKAKKGHFRAIHNRKIINTEVSSTFHGRDIFAPVAGWLAAGGAIDDVGPAMETPVLLPEVLFSIEAEFISAEVVHIDHFGNVITSIKRSDLPGELFESSSFALHINGFCIKEFYHTYSEAQQNPFVLWGSGGHLEISMKNSSASELVGAKCGQKFNLTLNHS